ncbi:kinetochore-associated protein NSL1 homolog [Hyla sarda]|uniref:kinetochore-associated protein NSL1 homolog n=1 Tax=Hyla sarda TaxID=327740 RepID=UPI0024C260F9|nr:kinetochore-associated protein NSL1 homolog [Hyla sarda]
MRNLSSESLVPTGDGFDGGTLPAPASGVLKMAAKDDSPKRRSLRLQRRSKDNVTPDSLGANGPLSGRRTSGPRTRLSAGKRSDSGSGGGSSVERPQRRSRGQREEEPKGGAIPGQGGPSGVTTRDQAPDFGAPDEKLQGRAIKTRGSQDGLQDDGRLSRLEPKVDIGSSPSRVNQEGNHVSEAKSSQGSKERSQENVGQIEDIAHEVRTSSSTSRTTDGEKAGPSVERMRTDVEEAGPSGVNNVQSSEITGPSRNSDLRNNENPSTLILSPSRRLVCENKSPVRNTDQGTSDPASAPAALRDSKVQCTSKQLLQEVLEMCAEFSKEILESQNYLNKEQRQQEQKNFMMNFETSFQDNVSINGQSWHEAPDTPSEPDIKILEDQLDDAIVDVAMKRKRHPRKILSHVVQALKLEREILHHYKPVVEPKEFKLDSRSESRMREQTATTAAISQQIKETMKALPAQLEKAEGFSQALNLQPVLQGSHVRHKIFSSHVVLQDVAKTVPKEIETTPRENAAAANAAAVRGRRKRQSPPVQHHLYPRRSKRKISLEG